MARTQFKDLANKDFDNMCKHVKLRTSHKIEELLLMQTVEGHTHEGDGAFRNKRRFPEVTIEDVVYVLGYDTDDIKQERQELIDEMKDFTNRIIRGDKVKDT